MKFQGFIGPSYTLNSVNVDCQRCVNMYPELIESGTGKESQRYYFKSTPGLELAFTVGSGPIRGIHIGHDNRIYVISGYTVYLMTYNGTTWTSEDRGNVGVSATFVDVAASSTTTVFLDGTYNYIDNVDPGMPADGIYNFSGAFLIGVPTATKVVFIDGYFIYNKANTNEFYVSDWNTMTVNPLSFATAEGDPDNGVTMIANERLLWLFNERTTEVFANTGNVDFPFERISGGFIEKGCVAADSVDKIDGFIFWLGRDATGEGIVFAAQGLTPQRISTHALENAIKGYADMSTAKAYTYQDNGHSFYVINFAEMSWAYDLSTKMWHERAYTGAVSLERHRANTHCFIPAYSVHLVGDYENGKVYKFSDSVYADNTNPITRLRTFPHLSAGGKRIFHNQLQIDMETGVGLDGGVQGSNPQVVMDYSNDGGHTWSDEAWASAEQNVGAIGNYKTRVIWRRLGSARDRVYRIKITDPVPVTLMSVDIDVEVGAN